MKNLYKLIDGSYIDLCSVSKVSPPVSQFQSPYGRHGFYEIFYSECFLNGNKIYLPMSSYTSAKSDDDYNQTKIKNDKLKQSSEQNYKKFIKAWNLLG